MEGEHCKWRASYSEERCSWQVAALAEGEEAAEEAGEAEEEEEEEEGVVVVVVLACCRTSGDPCYCYWADPYHRCGSCSFGADDEVRDLLLLVSIQRRACREILAAQCCLDWLVQGPVSG
jgi:hypothetical protein